MARNRNITKRQPNLTERLAAALLTMLRHDGAGKLVPIISHEDAKRLTAKQIIARFEFDHHPIRREAGGTNHPSNLTPMWKEDHRRKTAKKDIPEIAKIRHVRSKEQLHADRMADKGKRPAVRKTSRFGARKLVSRNTFARSSNV